MNLCWHIVIFRSNECGSNLLTFFWTISSLHLLFFSLLPDEKKCTKRSTNKQIIIKKCFKRIMKWSAILIVFVHFYHVLKMNADRPLEGELMQGFPCSPAGKWMIVLEWCLYILLKTSQLMTDLKIPARTSLYI